jgi:uncharacterized protein (TIGR02265 family)
MADELLVFEQTIEALFHRALNGRLTPRCKTRLREAGLDVEQKPRPAYTLTAWMTFLRITAEELHPGEPLEQAAFKLGQVYMEGFRETMLGRAVLSLLRVLGPRRALGRAAQSFRSSNNYTETRLTEVGPRHFELWLNEVGSLPWFSAGLIHGGLKVSGARDIRVDIAGYDGHACTFHVQWSETSEAPGVPSSESRDAGRSSARGSL